MRLGLIRVARVWPWCVLSLVSAAGALPVYAQPSAGCGTTVPGTPGQTDVKHMSGAFGHREYRLHLPPDYDNKTPTALVLNFHGYNGHALEQEVTTSRMSPHADRHGYIVVYPQSTSFPSATGAVTSWNDLSCNAGPGPAGPICADKAFDYPKPTQCQQTTRCDWCSCQDDVRTVEKLLDVLEGTLCIDRHAVFATGFSNGGMFVQRLGCNLGHRFAAVAAVSGTLARGYACAAPRLQPVSVMNIYGREDTIVPQDGALSSDGYFYTSVDDTVALWASPLSQSCEARATPYPTPHDGVRGVRCEQYASCRSGAQVVSCGWDAGHVWPSVKKSPDFGNDLIWNFFRGHTSPARR